MNIQQKVFFERREVALMKSYFSIITYLDNCSNSSSLSSISVAFKFSFKCATDFVPGINKILGERFSSQASAICAVVALCLAAMVLILFAIESGPDASGNHGINAIPRCAV